MEWGHFKLSPVGGGHQPGLPPWYCYNLKCTQWNLMPLKVNDNRLRCYDALFLYHPLLKKYYPQYLNCITIRHPALSVL